MASGFELILNKVRQYRGMKQKSGLKEVFKPHLVLYCLSLSHYCINHHVLDNKCLYINVEDIKNIIMNTTIHLLQKLLLIKPMTTQL